MGGIPLAANNLQPQPDMGANIQRLLALKSMMQGQQVQQGQIQEQQQNLQLTQQKVQDQKAVMEHMAQNPNDTFADAATALKGKISLPAYTNLLDTDASIRQKHAAATEAELGNFQKVHDAQQKVYSNVAGLSDEDLTKQWPAISQEFNSIPGNNAKIDPNQPLTQKQLQDHGVALGLQEAYLKQEQDKRKETAETTEAQQKGEEAAQGAAAKKQEALWYQLHPQAGAPGVAPETATAADWLAKNPGKGLSDFLVWKAQHSPTLLMQGGFGGANDPAVDLVGQNKMDLATALQRVGPAGKDAFLKNLSAKYPDFNQANFGIEKKVGESFTSGTYSQQLNAINTAREHMQTFKSLASALDNGDSQALNKLGNAWQEQFGSAAPTNFKLARDAFAGEVGKSLAGAGVTQGDRNKVEEAINGSESPKQLIGAAETADALLAGKQTALKQTYTQGKSAQPNFGTSAAPKTLTQAQIQQAAKDHGVSIIEATRQARAAGYTVNP